MLAVVVVVVVSQLLQQCGASLSKGFVVTGQVKQIKRHYLMLAVTQVLGVFSPSVFTRTDSIHTHKLYRLSSALNSLHVVEDTAIFKDAFMTNAL